LISSDVWHAHYIDGRRRNFVSFIYDFKAYVELEAEKKIKCLRINMLKEYRLWDPTA
jgi:hypothetical protein